MSREAMSEEERRQRRNEASRRCYLKRKAELAGQAQPVGAKNHKPKAETKAEAKPARRGPDPVVAAERLCRTYAKVANGVKPMIKDAAEFLGIIYKSEDQRVVEKVERILTKGLGVKVGRLESDPIETTRVCVDAASKAVKAPKCRLTQAEPEPEPEPNVEPEPQPENEPEPEDEPEVEDEPAEVPVDPAFLEKVDAGEADKSEIEIPQGKTDEDDEDEIDPEDDEYEDEDEIDSEEDEDEDEDDESEEARERRVRRRRREESDSVREYETGRWEMMGEMGAQGAFDD